MEEVIKEEKVEKESLKDLIQSALGFIVNSTNFIFAEKVVDKGVTITYVYEIIKAGSEYIVEKSYMANQTHVNVRSRLNLEQTATLLTKVFKSINKYEFVDIGEIEAGEWCDY